MSDIGHPRAMGFRVLGDVLTFPVNPAIGSGEQSGKHAQQAGFPAPVRTGQQQGAAGIDREVQSGKHGAFAADASRACVWSVPAREFRLRSSKHIETGRT